MVVSPVLLYLCLIIVTMAAGIFFVRRLKETSRVRERDQSITTMIKKFEEHELKEANRKWRVIRRQLYRRCETHFIFSHKYLFYTNGFGTFDTGSVKLALIRTKFSEYILIRMLLIAALPFEVGDVIQYIQCLWSRFFHFESLKKDHFVMNDTNGKIRQECLFVK